MSPLLFKITLMWEEEKAPAGFCLLSVAGACEREGLWEEGDFPYMPSETAQKDSPSWEQGITELGVLRGATTERGCDSLYNFLFYNFLNSRFTRAGV